MKAKTSDVFPHVPQIGVDDNAGGDGAGFILGKGRGRVLTIRRQCVTRLVVGGGKTANQCCRRLQCQREERGNERWDLLRGRTAGLSQAKVCAEHIAMGSVQRQDKMRVSDCSVWNNM